MHARVAELLRALTVEAAPCPEDVDWSAVRKRWGTSLPADYIGFLETCGAGGFEDYLEVFQPQAIDGRYGCSVQEATPKADELERLSSPFPAFPEPGGLICWGADSSADKLYWRTVSKDPNEWTVVVWRRHKRSAWVEYPCGFAEFLIKMIRGEWDECPLSSADLWAKEAPRFMNWRAEFESWEQGIDPHTGEPSPYEGMFGGDEPITAAYSAQSTAQTPQLAVLGFAMSGANPSTADLSIAATIALGPSRQDSLRLDALADFSGVAVEITGPDGMIAIASGQTLAAAGSALQGGVVVTKNSPLTFNLVVPQSALPPGQAWAQVVRGAAAFGGPVSINVILTDPALGAFRAAEGQGGHAGDDDVLIGSWPPVGVAP